MFPDSKNPFAAAPSNGSQSPFQSASANGNTPATTSPFGAPPQPPIPEAKKSTSDVAASPFSLGAGEKNSKSDNSTPFEPSLVEPTEGFAANEPAAPRRDDAKPAAIAAVAAVASSSSSSPGPVAMPDSRPVNVASNANDSGANRSDPFAVPTPTPAAAAAAATPAPAGRGDFVLPAEGEKADPVQRASAPVQAAPGQLTPAAATPAVVAAVTGETSQLVLRAIFGVTRELNREEILERARTLPGIRNLQMVGASEGAAMSSLRESIQRMGFGDKASLTLTTSGGVVDIIEEPGTTLAVLFEGSYAAGVRETLIIVARELSSLK